MVQKNEKTKYFGSISRQLSVVTCIGGLGLRV